MEVQATLLVLAIEPFGAATQCHAANFITGWRCISRYRLVFLFVFNFKCSLRRSIILPPPSVSQILSFVKGEYNNAAKPEGFLECLFGSFSLCLQIRRLN